MLLPIGMLIGATAVLTLERFWGTADVQGAAGVVLLGGLATAVVAAGPGLVELWRPPDRAATRFGRRVMNKWKTITADRWP